MLGRLFRRAGAAPPAGAQELLAQAYAHHQAGRLDLARTGYRALLAAQPDNFYGEYMLGVIELQEGRPGDAMPYLERAVSLAPRDAGAHNSLAETLRRLGRVDEALERLRHATQLDPALAEPHLNLASLLRRLGRNDEAIGAYRRALTLNPDLVEAHAGLAQALHEAGNLDEALACAQRALAGRPESAALHLAAGNLLLEKGFVEEAAAAYRAALARDPGLAEAGNNLGNLLRHQGRADEALACYEQALRAKPDFAEPLFNAAQLLRELGRYAEAAAACRLLLEMRPGMSEAHLGLGNALKGMGDDAGALACYARALEADPDNADARWAFAMSQLPVIAQDEAELAASRVAFRRELAALERWCDERGADRAARAVGTQQPFYLAYQEGDHRELLARYGALCARLMGAWQQATGLPMPARVTRAQIRVGVVSAHVSDHSVWHGIVKGWLQHLDRARFDVRLFHLGSAHDAETLLAKTLVSHYVGGRAEFHEWARQILSHQLDVLVYPEIGMDPTTVKLASLRLAPVQATSWGHPLTSGLPTMDYYLSASALEAPDADAHYTEKLVRLPGVGSAYTPSAVTPGTVDLAALGVRDGVPLLLCPGTPFKYTPRHDAALAEIARRLGECQLVFFTPRLQEPMLRLRERMARAFAGAGLELDACAAFVPWQSRAGFYGLLHEADVCLDTMGFSGYNTAMQAIECGLPVLAWEGRFLRGRLASGVLRRIGMDELVADADEAYVEKAVRLARDAAYWGDVRERMLAARTALHGDTAPVRALERFLEGAVRG